MCNLCVFFPILAILIYLSFMKKYTKRNYYSEFKQRGSYLVFLFTLVFVIAWGIIFW